MQHCGFAGGQRRAETVASTPMFRDAFKRHRCIMPAFRTWPVSRRVNKTGTGDDDPTLIDEVAA
jgi:hypothetical protein